MLSLKELLNSKKELALAFAAFADSFEVTPDNEINVSDIEFNLYELKGMLEEFDENLRNS
jgi:hypothetical protein